MCNFMETVYRPCGNRLRIHQVLGSLKLIGVAKTSNLLFIKFFHVKCLFLSSLTPWEPPLGRGWSKEEMTRWLLGTDLEWKVFGRGSYRDGVGRSVEGGHISQRIKGTEGMSESHEKKHHAPESPHPRIRHTEVSGVRRLYQGLPQHPLTHVDGHSGTLWYLRPQKHHWLDECLAEQSDWKVWLLIVLRRYI